MADIHFTLGAFEWHASAVQSGRLVSAVRTVVAGLAIAAWRWLAGSFGSGRQRAVMVAAAGTGLVCRHVGRAAWFVGRLRAGCVLACAAESSHDAGRRCAGFGNECGASALAALAAAAACGRCGDKPAGFKTDVGILF